MGCVYKEVAWSKDNGIWVPKIKLSNDTIKIVNPDYKKLYRAYDKTTGFALADVMARHNEKLNKRELSIVSVTDFLKSTTLNNFDLVELQKPIFVNGELVYDDPSIREKQAYCNKEMGTLYPEVKRTTMPHEYYVDGTEEYVNFKNKVIQDAKRLVKRF